jgi:hypothetical protein
VVTQAFLAVILRLIVEDKDKREILTRWTILLGRKEDDFSSLVRGDQSGQGDKERKRRMIS